MKKSKLISSIAVGIACILGLGGAIGARQGLFNKQDAEVREVKADSDTIYTFTFFKGMFQELKWWGNNGVMSGNTYHGSGPNSVDSSGNGTFNCNKGYENYWIKWENPDGCILDSITIDVNIIGGEMVASLRGLTEKKETKLLDKTYPNGTTQISFTGVNKKYDVYVIYFINKNSSNPQTTYYKLNVGGVTTITGIKGNTVTLNPNGGTGGTDKVVAMPDTAMPAITVATRTGYTLTGYYDDTSGGTKYYNADGSSAKNWDKSENATLYAQWTANSYTVRYYGNKPSNASTTVSGLPSNYAATYDTNFTLGSAPTLTGWTFGGWYKESSCTNKVGNPGDSVKNVATSGNANLFAKWTANTYKVIYNDNKPSTASGSVTNMPSAATWTYDSNATLGSAPTLTGYTFGGWYKDAECTTKAGNAGASLTKPNYSTGADVNLYAKWTVNQYTVAYDGNKPEKAPAQFNVTGVPASQTWTYDASGNLGSAPHLVGYVFGGWYKESSCTNKVGDAGENVINIADSGTTTLYAKWTIDPAIQAVIDAINATKTVPYDELTDQINTAQTGYNNLTTDYQEVIISEGYKEILDNAIAADAVGQMIEDLGTAQDTDAWKEAVSQARTAYEALNDKSFIPTDTILKILEDDEAAVVVMNAINAIGDHRWTDACKALIDDAQAAYDAYIDAGHPVEQIANYQELLDAHTVYNNVQTFVDKVNAITNNPFEYTPECKALIDEARRYYEEDMSEYQKFVTLIDAKTYYDLLCNYENAYNAMYLIDQINDMEDDPACGEKIQAARTAVDDLNPTTEMPLMDADLLKELTDKEAAWAVIEKINAIYPMVYGQECEDDIEAARNAFNALNDDQEQFVVNYDELTKAEGDYIAVKAVVVEVNNLGDIRHDQASKDKIEHARESYEALTSDQKDFYPDSSLQDIVDYETSYEALDKIYEIAGVDYDTDPEGRIKEAREFYDSLSEDQKALINKDDLAVLLKAEADYGTLKKNADILVISLLIVSSLLIIGGFFVIFLLLKKKKKKDEDEGNGKKKPVKMMSIGGLLPGIVLVSHYLDPSFLALYVLASIVGLVWLTVLVLVILKKKEVGPFKKDETETVPATINDVTTSAEEEEEVETVTDEKGNIFQIRYIKSFTAKLIQSPEETKKYYEELKNEVLSYKNTHSRISWHFDSVNSGRNYVLRFAVRGKTLCVYFPLNVDDYTDSKYKVEKAESKRYEDVPCLYRIKNDRRLGYAKELIATVASNLGLEKGEEQHEVYSNLPYEPNKPLVARGLIKEQKVQVNKPATAPVVLETKTNSDGDEVIVTKDASGNIFEIRYIKSFTAKLSQSEDVTKDYYTVLKNYVLSYKGTHSRVSWHYDAINVGRDYVLKFAIRGKTLCVYYALDASKVEEKYKVEDGKGRKFEDVPVLYRIKNDRRLGYAKELIDLLMSDKGLTKGEEQSEDYHIPSESTKALLAKGLIKEVKTKVQDKAVIERYESITVEKADEVMSDEKAEEAIEVDNEHSSREGAKAVVNIDTLSENFNDGDEVTLEKLIEKKLVPSKTGYVKVLARGVLDKKLTVDLNDYSLQAVKMIVLVGGHAKRIQ